MDPRVIDIPFLIRFFLVNFIIIPARVSNSTKEYKKLWAKFSISPLVDYAEKLTIKLNSKFADKADFYFAMRYQNPSIDSTLRKIYSNNYEELIIMPLYPQYASASTGSTIEYCNNIINKWWNIPKIKIINQFYNHESYINCFVENTKKLDYKSYDHILFSYHGLPERHVDKTYTDNSICADNNCEEGISHSNKFCYKAMCYETSKLIASNLELSDDRYSVCFQSRLDNKWIKPYTDKVMLELLKLDYKKLLVLSPAFISDCLETSIEISDTNREEFIKHGGTEFKLVPSLNDNDNWVNAIVDIINFDG
jgi:ferrochelatase